MGRKIKEEIEKKLTSNAFYGVCILSLSLLLEYRGVEGRLE